ncbi:MAG: DUF5996 family protein, partial [Fimbriimonas sp.]
MWTQVVGKITLALTPRSNHFWNVAMHLGSRGLVTPLLTQGARSFRIEFDFLSHELVIVCSDGSTGSIPLEPMTVTDFYHRVRAELKNMELEVKFWPVPVEIPDPIPFAEDTLHASYERSMVEAFWRALLFIKPVMEEFRCEFLGKCSPVHFFWGSFDLAVSRFSGKTAPARPEMGSIYAESYSHEVISHGFWPGSGPLQEPAFYAYCVPPPTGFAESHVSPAGAYYHRELGEFILPYESVRTSDNPALELREFLDSTYEAAANKAGWDRQSLERPLKS